MATIRVVVPSAGAHTRSVAAHVRSLQQAGRCVVLVTANRPYQTLMERFEADGVAAQDVFVVDAVSCLDGGHPPQRLPNALFLQSPTMLEMIAMRTEQVLARLGDGAHVVVDSLNAFALYNGSSPVQEFAHYVANRLRSRGVDGDLLVLDDPQGHALAEAVAGFTDARAEVGA